MILPANAYETLLLLSRLFPLFVLHVMLAVGTCRGFSTLALRERTLSCIAPRL
jgi:hypothetical protein